MSLWHFVVREQVFAQTGARGRLEEEGARARGVSAAPGLVNPPQPPGAAVVSLACLVEVRTAGVLLSARLAAAAASEGWGQHARGVAAHCRRIFRGAPWVPSGPRDFARPFGPRRVR